MLMVHSLPIWLTPFPSLVKKRRRMAGPLISVLVSVNYYWSKVYKMIISASTLLINESQVYHYEYVVGLLIQQHNITLTCILLLHIGFKKK